MDRAESEYRTVLRIDPSMWQGYLQLGRLLMDTGRSEQAEPVLVRAVQLDSKNPESIR